MIPYFSVNTNDPVTRAIDDGVGRSLDSIQNNPLLNNPTIIIGVVITSADTLVYHKLGRTVKGFIVINSNAAAKVYKSSTVNIAPTAQIILKSDVTVTVDLLFF